MSTYDVEIGSSFSYEVETGGQTYNVRLYHAGVGADAWASPGVFNAMDYSAQGDGVTDDTAAIQAALTACGAAVGGRVDLPPGTYLISSSLNISSNTHLRGWGIGSTTILVDSGAALGEGILQNENYGLGSSAGDVNIEISGLTIDNNQEVPASGSARGVWFKNVTDSVIRDVEVIDAHKESVRVYGLGTGESSNILIERVISKKDSSWLYWNNAAGIAVTSYASDSTNSADDAVKVFDIAVRDCFVNSCTQGVQVFNAQRVTIEGCHLENCDHRGVNIGPTSLDISAVGNTVLESGGTGIHSANRNKRITIVGNTCRDTLRDPSTVGQEGQGIKAYWGCEDLTITGNTCEGNYSDGIAVEGLGEAINNFTICGNTCNDNGRDGVRLYGGVLAGTGGTVSDGTVVGNTCTDNANSGVYVGTDNASYIVSNTLIDGNFLKGNSQYGVEVNYGDNIRIGVNHLVSNTVGRYSLSNMTNTQPMTVNEVLAAVADDATPSVAGISVLKFGDNTSPLAITNLDDGIEGQEVTLVVTGSANTPTIADSGNFNLSAAWAPGTGDTLKLVLVGSTWIEVSSSNN